jgi:formimidoylglutamate deiminase
MAQIGSTLWFEQACLPGGWAGRVRLTLRDGLIAAIETGVAAVPGDERHAIGLPGLPNLHSHAFQRGMAGLAEVGGPAADSFWTWRDIMYRFVGRIDPAALRALAALADVEMLEGGFTRVGEFHYLHHDPAGAGYADPAEMAAAIAAAAEESGIALTLLPVFYAHSGFGGAPPGEAQRRFITDPAGFGRLVEASRAIVATLPDAVVGIAPHSLRAATLGELREILPLAPGGPVHIHIAEQEKEVADCVAWSGRRPVEWLFEHLPVGPDWCLVHATHMTEAEIDRLAASSAVAGLCPITEANLGDGLFPATRFAAAGGSFGIGSDSNVLIDATEELRLLEYGQRLAARGRNVVGGGEGRSTGAALYRAALVGGARALGAPAALAEGAPADIVSLRADHPSLVGRSGDALIDALVFAAGRPAIDCVWRRGARLVSAGRHRDRAAIAQRYSVTLQQLLAGSGR